MIVVCGLHRSGTTFVGKLLHHAGYCVVHEPLNERFGMEDVPISYPYANDNKSIFAPLLDDAIKFARHWNKDVSYIKAKGVRRKIFSITGGKSGMRWGWLRLRKKIGNPHVNICLKDPFMTLATPFLLHQYHLNIICMVRHPAAIHYSSLKQGWRFDVNNLLKQPDLLALYGHDIPSVHWDLARKHPAASIALLWKIMIRINSGLTENKQLLMISHEALCIEPIDIGRRICMHAGISFSHNLNNFLLNHCYGERAESKVGYVHDFRRNSKSLVTLWRSHINLKDELMMREMIGDKVEEFYGKW